MTGADAMVKCLEAQGIDVVFGYPGVAIAPLFNSLYHSKIQSILVRQEQNGGHAASGYARVTRKPAVCIATSGPGGNQSDYRYCYGLCGQYTDGGDHRAGIDPPFGKRRFSGGRYYRCMRTICKIQLPC